MKKNNKYKDLKIGQMVWLDEEEKRKREKATIKRELAELKRLKEKYEQGE